MSPAILLAIFKAAIKAVPAKSACVCVGDFNENGTIDFQIRVQTKSGEEIKLTVDVPFLDAENLADAVDNLL